MPIVKLSSKGQVVIPAEIRESFELYEGDRLLIERKDSDIVIKPVAKLSRLKGIDKGAWKDTSKEIDKMREEWDKEFE
ncbi:MAG: AbrB/MazE/SpoVT family DNA-binding domain-containing protein [Euryarchaeota archaeon]|nr:AbrB/MazE/SpoVT family DNA-binding domain-containing protein [Euryarchaeota archaeon]